MTTDKPKRKRKRREPAPYGRAAPTSSGSIPVEDDLIPGIPDTPENVARSFWKPPKKDGEWRYQKKYGRKRN